MILRLKQFVVEQEEKNIGEAPKVFSGEKGQGNLVINWQKPDLAEEIDHYDDKAKLEFYQHNITIGNRDIGKVSPRATKFYINIFQSLLRKDISRIFRLFLMMNSM